MNCNHLFGAASFLSSTDKKLMSINLNPIRTEVQVNPALLTIHGRCPFCNENWTVVDVPTAGFHAWRGGQHVQTALPNLSAQQREFLISGVCADCWSKL